MSIMYKSTRSNSDKVTASQAILKGLADDGGLFVPDSIPALEVPLEKLADMTYQETAYEVMKLFLSDFTEEELKHCINGAYDDKFDTKEIAPLVKKDGAYYLELFHGKTIAFKDMALSILPYLMTTAAKKNGVKNEIVILTATSGDTGKAALAGFADVPGTSIIVFYPKNGVSPIQEKQMLTQKGENTNVVGIIGNFDDAQTGVKEMFHSKNLAERMNAKGYQFSSANSINIGRLVPQIVYYVYAYGQLLKQGEITCGEKMNVVVPTGNFGNILAAFYAKNMGLPIETLYCAFILTSSPSMDILISSNLERLIYRITGEDAAQTKVFMDALSNNGEYTITKEMMEKLSCFVGGYASEAETAANIKKVFDKAGYIMDTHTSVASCVYYDKAKDAGLKTVIASTASPYKFTRSVMDAIDKEKYDSMTDFELVDELNALSGVKIPEAIEEIRTAPIRHDIVCDKSEMQMTVEKILGL